MLLEVVITALIVGLITIATLTGFNDVDKTTASQRQHDEAAFLAAESQEALRSDPASALELLETKPEQYTQFSGGNTYTITQQAKILGAGESSGACSVTKKSRQSANAIRVTSTVTWPEQQHGHRPAVTEVGLITPPTGSGFEVDAGNAPNPTAGVSGVTAQVQYSATKGGPSATVSQTTGNEGCVIFTGIPATSALVSIKETVGYVTVGGSPSYPAKEVTLAPNYTTHDLVTYNLGGAIEAAFAYKGKSEYTHPNNENTGEITEKVKGDTFVVSNTEMNAGVDFELGSTRSRLGTGGIYEALPGAAGEPSPYEARATSPKEPAKYPNGNLFPFPKSTETEKGENSWGVYAGDCPANNPETVTGSLIKPQEYVSVSPAATTPAVAVPMSYVELSLYKGTKLEEEQTSPHWKALETEYRYLATITDTKCAGITPDNEAAIKDEHVQETTNEAFNPKDGGHLQFPFQPFGEYELCVYSAKGKTYTVHYSNTANAKGEPQGGTPAIFLGQRSTSERETLRAEEETKEKATETARLKTEGETKKSRETSEKSTKTKAEELEKTEKTKWEKQYNVEHVITHTELLNKESTQRAAKTTREGEEATKKKNAETAEEGPRKEAETKEKATKEARVKREEAETKEDTAVAVESGQSKCP